jgi:hypothetical protein
MKSNAPVVIVHNLAFSVFAETCIGLLSVTRPRGSLGLGTRGRIAVFG